MPCSRKLRTVLVAEPVRRKVSKNVRTAVWTWRSGSSTTLLVESYTRPTGNFISSSPRRAFACIPPMRRARKTCNSASYADLGIMPTWGSGAAAWVMTTSPPKSA